MKKAALVATVIIIAGFATAYWYFSDRGRFTTEPEFTGLAHTVSGNDLVSNADPDVILRFDPAYHHVGGQKFILCGVADTEQHFFVETTDDNKLKSAYWVQYEAYLPDNSYRYDYDDSPLRVMLGDYEFYTDTDVVERDPNRKRRRGADGTLARQFLANNGYVFPDNHAYARLVYLTDDSRRKELMIIFIDDLAAYGLTASELMEGGDSAAQWPVVEKAHLDKIKRTLTMLPRRAEY